MEITIGKYKVTSAKTTLTATGVGSCLVITFFDRKKRVGGMAHASLPLRPRHDLSKEHEAGYVDSAIQAMLIDMKHMGTKRENVECKLVGGSNMFPSMETQFEDVGQKNIESAKKKLNEMNIPLIAESVGGALGRSVEFCLETGIVTVKLKF